MTRILACLITAKHLDDATAAAPGYLPAILLSGRPGLGDLGSQLEHLVSRGWSYAEPPMRLTPVPSQDSEAHVQSARQPMLLTPCPSPDEPTLVGLGAPPQSRSEWSQLVRQLEQRCAVVLAPTVDLHASGLREQLDCEASRGRIIWTTVRITCATATPSGRADAVAP